VGKNKLARWAEIKTFKNVIEPDTRDVKDKFYHLRGSWKEKYFGNYNPIILELGCGKGEYTTGMAAMIPEKNFIGVDIKGARIWRGAKTAIENNLSNVLFIRTRVEFINSFFEEDEIDEIWLTFPDPHEKRRNTLHRLTSPLFLNKYRIFLKNNGIVHLKTDNNILYNYTLNIAIENNLEILASTADLYNSGIVDDILGIRTFYEAKFMNEEKKICYLSFRLKKEKEIVYE